MLGYSVQERIGENPLDLIHPDDLQFVIDTLNSLKSIGKNLQYNSELNTN